MLNNTHSGLESTSEGDDGGSSSGGCRTQMGDKQEDVNEANNKKSTNEYNTNKATNEVTNIEEDDTSRMQADSKSPNDQSTIVDDDKSAQDQNQLAADEVPLRNRMLASPNRLGGECLNSSQIDTIEEIVEDTDGIGSQQQPEQNNQRLNVTKSVSDNSIISNSGTSAKSRNNNNINNGTKTTSASTTTTTSRLKRATKALLLFRRPTPMDDNNGNGRACNDNGIALHDMNDGHSSSAGFSEHHPHGAASDSGNRFSTAGRVHQLAASFGTFWRQNISNNNNRIHHNYNNNIDDLSNIVGDETNSGIAKRRKSSKWMLSASKSTGHISSERADDDCQTKRFNWFRTNGPSNDGAIGSGSGNCLPSFIVPKLNALKFPIVCRIKSIEGELMQEIFVHRYEEGQYLMDNLKVTREIQDPKYFGLRIASNVDDQESIERPWLDLQESVCKQINKFGITSTSAGSMTSLTNGIDKQPSQQMKSVDFYLRIKFYPPNLARVQTSFLRDYLFLQLRRDLRLGKLTSSRTNLTQLMACVLQYELGDYRPELVSEQLTEMKIMPNQDVIEQEALDIWETRMVGFRKHQAQMHFLRICVILETYGFDYYVVRDHQRSRGFLLGFNYAGIKLIRNGKIIYHFKWNSLSKICYERRMIIFHVYPNENSKVSLTC